MRMDTHACQGYRIPPNYDSMIGKLITYGPDRPAAIATMRRALDEFRAGPVKTTIPLLRQIMANEQFVESRVDTGWLERTYKAAT